MPLHADLYVDKIDLDRHIGGATCDVCRVASPGEFIERLRSGQIRSGECPHWSAERIEAFRYALDAGETLPTIPSLEVPRPAEVGLFDLNEPTHDSPLLVTGNSSLTHEVLLAVLSTATAPMWMLSVETGGHTVDMSMVYRTLTAEGVARAVAGEERLADTFVGRVILPGLAGPLAEPLSALLGPRVEVGPICAAELPLFMGPAWQT